jgi:hypothetical protein
LFKEENDRRYCNPAVIAAKIPAFAVDLIKCRREIDFFIMAPPLYF